MLIVLASVTTYTRQVRATLGFVRATRLRYVVQRFVRDKVVASAISQTGSLVSRRLSGGGAGREPECQA